MSRIRIVEDQVSVFGRRVRVVFDETNIVDIEELKDGSVSLKLSHRTNDAVIKVTPAAKEYRDAIDQLKAIFNPLPPAPIPTVHTAASLDAILGIGVPITPTSAQPESRATSNLPDRI